jgi:hypothetical protein
MILAQLTFLILITIAFGSLLKIKLSNGIRVFEKIIILFLFLIGFLLIFYPSILRFLADLLNISRGVDLFYYLYIIISTWFLLRTHIRANRIEKRINQIVSKISLPKKSKN